MAEPNESNQSTQVPTQTEPAPARSASLLRRLLFVGVVLIVLAGVGGVVWWRFLSNAQPAQEQPPAPEATGVVSPEPFLVNLADAESQRFARVTVRLVAGTQEEAKKLGADELIKARVRAALLDLLMKQNSTTLLTSDGKEVLKKEIADAATPILGLKVQDVLFTDFVIQ